MASDLNTHLKHWLVDLQLSDDPKQYLLARAAARILELEALLWQWENLGREVREHFEGANNANQTIC